MDVENQQSIKILFVCIGNSCRSPMAEAVMKNLITKTNLDWQVDSAAIASWNVGLRPEPRCIKILAENGLKTDHIARQIRGTDFNSFDYIFGMDYANIEDLYELAPKDCKAKIQLLGNYDTERDNIILDPYFEVGEHGFRKCYEQITRSCKEFLEKNIV